MVVVVQVWSSVVVVLRVVVDVVLVRLGSGTWWRVLLRPVSGGGEAWLCVVDCCGRGVVLRLGCGSVR